MSSDNDRSYLIGAHELGHSIGELADEYQYPGYGPYPWAEEPAAANLTLRRDPAEAKWHRWAGVQDPTGSVVGTYEGGGYYETGVHRPTDTSLMRTLAATEFNVVGREAMIAGFYADADALTSPVPTAEPVRGTRPITVRLAPLTGLADLPPHLVRRRQAGPLGDRPAHGDPVRAGRPRPRPPRHRDGDRPHGGPAGPGGPCPRRQLPSPGRCVDRPAPGPSARRAGAGVTFEAAGALGRQGGSSCAKPSRTGPRSAP